MKSLKAQFIGAIAMVLVAAIAMGSSTYAWFAMNTTVTAKNMTVKAVAENGIVISNSSKSNWSNTADAQATSASLFPTSTKAALDTTGSTNVPYWAHNTSPSTTNANANGALTSNGGYTDLALLWSATTEGTGYTEAGANTQYDAGVDPAYVLMDNFYIKASGAELSAQTLYINEVTVTRTGTVHAIDNALRVLVVVNNAETGFIFAPVSDVDGGTTTLSYKWKNTTDVTAIAAGTKNTQAATNLTIPNTDGGAVNVRIYVYYEGEDANCKSVNISGIEVANLEVAVKFGTATIA